MPLTLRDVDLCNPDSYVAGVPHEMFRLLRHTDPVHWHEEVDGSGFWAVTKLADVTAVSRDHASYSSARKSAFLDDPDPESMSAMQLMMVNMDPPRHTKLRLLVNKGFTPRMVAQLEKHIRDITNEILDRAEEKNEFDFVTEVAADLPLMVIAEVLGVPTDDRRMVFDWSNRLIGFDDPEYQTSPEDAQIVSREMYAYANQLAVERRANPRHDLISVLMDAEVEGEKLTELEFDLFFILLAVAGNETTRNAISGGLLALCENPDEKRRLVADPSLMATAVEEIVRYHSSVMQFRRTAMRDTELRGKQIRDGDKVILWYISANRDEDVFYDPDRFDVGRTPNDHIAFGAGGPHFCLGANLARLEIQVMFEELLRRFPDIELTGPVRRLRSNFINGIKEMPVRLRPG